MNDLNTFPPEYWQTHENMDPSGRCSQKRARRMQKKAFVKQMNTKFKVRTVSKDTLPQSASNGKIPRAPPWRGGSKQVRLLRKATSPINWESTEILQRLIKSSRRTFTVAKFLQRAVVGHIVQVDWIRACVANYCYTHPSGFAIISRTPKLCDLRHILQMLMCCRNSCFPNRQAAITLSRKAHLSN